jgi:apolipoprotein D and lipocalin family protein
MKALATALLLLLSACTGMGDGRPPPSTVPSVDLQRYLGTWYEIARFPNRFQDGGNRRCEATSATYAARPDGRIAVTNRCVDAGAGGVERIAQGQAYAVPGTGDAKLRVSFFWPFYGDYWVIALDPDYRWAVVGSPGRDYLWVLSRTPAMSPGDYAGAVSAAAGEGFEVARLQPTPQPGR